MSKQIFMLSLLLLLVGAVVGAVPEFKYVGQYNGKDYWASLPAYVEPSGQIYKKCQEKFGSSAYTSSINDVNEWNFVRGQLSANFQCPGCTRNFWINGKYDRPHGAGENVVITVTGNVVGTKISKVANEYRYICEVPVVIPPTTTQAPHSTSQDVPANPTPVQECNNQNDVIVVLDSSGSVGIDNYRKEKVFAYDLARVFANQEVSRFGFTIFSSSTQTLVPLDNSWSNDEIYGRVLNATYMGYTTNTDLAINSARLEYSSSAQTSVPKNIVVITDGLSNDPGATKTAADIAIASGIRIFAVGIGPWANDAELLDITGGNSNQVFKADNFDQLTSIVNPVGQAVCN
ncbi:hypothetical protein HA402_013077 [Bradysia odoriphaga]|nr:hypothetical protein HA402_013077 [Bradysia odoriphaga]